MYYVDIAAQGEYVLMDNNYEVIFTGDNIVRFWEEISVFFIEKFGPKPPYDVKVSECFQIALLLTYPISKTQKVNSFLKLKQQEFQKYTEN